MDKVFRRLMMKPHKKRLMVRKNKNHLKIKSLRTLKRRNIARFYKLDV